MTRNDVLTLVAESICEETKYPEQNNISDATTARDVPGWDSLAHVRIMLGIEMELDITVPLDSTYKVDTVGGLVDLVHDVASNN